MLMDPRKTGNTLLKNSFGAKNIQKNYMPIGSQRESSLKLNQDYDCHINNMRREKKQNLNDIGNSEKLEEPQDSFSYDKNDNSNQTFQDNNISLNKLNYLSYDKKVKAVHNPTYANNVVDLEEEKILAHKTIKL